MAGPMITALTFLVDGTSAYAATTWNTPYTQIANLWDSHVLNASQNGAVVYAHDDTHIKILSDYAQTTPRATVPVLVRTAIDQLIQSWNEITGTGAGNYRTASVPMTLATINTNLTTNSTAAFTPNTWATRDSNGATAFKQVVSIAYSTIVPAEVLRPNGAATQVVQQTFNNSVGGAVTLSWDSAGNLTANTVTAATFTGALTAASLADFKPATNVSADTITIAAGGNYADSLGNFIPAQGAQNAALTNAGSVGQPSGTNMQWVAISLQASNGAFLATGGAVAASPAKPTFPVGNMPIAMVARRGATTNPSGVIAAIDILDARTPGGGGGGTGSGSGAPIASAYAIFGAVGTLTNATNIETSTGASAVNIHPAYIKADQNSGPVSDAINNYVQPDVVSRVQISGSGSSTLTVIKAGSGTGGSILTTPVTIALYGSAGTRVRTNTADVSTGNVPVTANNPVYLVATLPSGSAGWTIAYSTTGNTGEYSILLAVGFYDGSTVHYETTGFKQLGAVRSTQVVPTIITCNGNGQTDTAFSSIGSYTKPPNMPTKTFWVPELCTGMLVNNTWGEMKISQAPAFDPLVEGYALITNTTTGATLSQLTGYWLVGMSYPSAATGTAGMYFDRGKTTLVTLTPGVYTMTGVVQTVETHVTVDLKDRTIDLMLFAT